MYSMHRMAPRMGACQGNLSPLPLSSPQVPPRVPAASPGFPLRRTVGNGSTGRVRKSYGSNLLLGTVPGRILRAGVVLADTDT